MARAGVVLCAALVFLLASSQAFAIDRMLLKREDGRNVESRFDRLFDPATIETISGKVEAVLVMEEVKGTPKGVHLNLRTASGTIPVHLGPEWYMDEQAMHIKANDDIEVTGSRVELDSGPAIIASKVAKGDELLNLRDRRGRPLWMVSSFTK